MSTTSGELRETLMEAITAVRAGTLDANDAKAMAQLAMAITTSLMTEVALRKEELSLKRDGSIYLIGQTPIGEITDEKRT